jgi:glycosyltransferase involved in cell wall biosynthesis
MTKLIIQIPCLNEADTLHIALDALPRKIDGIDEIEVLIINDGSTDGTVSVAREYGVDHIVGFPRNRGLATAFVTGLETSLQQGADIIVNTDADNQYNAEDIAELVKPILENRADIVIGERPIAETSHFSPIKKILQRLGSWTVRLASKTTVGDAPSGFRAFSREAAQQINIFSEYTYTLESIIQAGQKGLNVVSVPIRTNEDLRPSKLMSSMMSYVVNSSITILRIFIIYRPFRFFGFVGGTMFLLGLLIGLRFLFILATGQGDGHVQSLLLSSILLSMGFFTLVIGILADLIAVNRKLSERISWRLSRIEEKLVERKTE